MSLITDFVGDLVTFLLRETERGDQKYFNIVKQHTEKLKTNGDVGFSTSIKAWLPLANGNLSAKVVDESDVKFQKELIEASKQWIFPVKRIQCAGDRCVLFLDRAKSMENILKHILNENTKVGHLKEPVEEMNKMFDISLLLHDNENSLTQLRCTLVGRTVTNLLLAVGYDVKEEKKDWTGQMIRVIITHSRRRDEQKRESTGNSNQTAARKIVCGLVNSQENVSASDYIGRRAQAMERISAEKCNIGSYDFPKLGIEIVSFELLQSRYSSVVSLEQLMEQSTTAKGAVFVLYNVARLETILTAFDEQVRKGFYEKLPDLDTIDFGLLKEEEEWQMAYTFIDGYPNLLKRCLADIESGQIAVHLLCIFLSNFASLFSVYYHRVKILTENSPASMAVIHARVHFLRSIRLIFYNALKILEIEPLKRM